VAPPLLAVHWYTGLELKQAMLIRVQPKAPANTIVYVFGQPPNQAGSADTHYVLVQENEQGIVLNRATGTSGTATFSAIIPPTNVLLTITSNYSQAIVGHIGNRLLALAPGLLTLNVKGVPAECVFRA
jgi:hypothetical protein